MQQRGEYLLRSFGSLYTKNPSVEMTHHLLLFFSPYICCQRINLGTDLFAFPSWSDISVAPLGFEDAQLQSFIAHLPLTQTIIGILLGFEKAHLQSLHFPLAADNPLSAAVSSGLKGSYLVATLEKTIDHHSKTSYPTMIAITSL